MSVLRANEVNALRLRWLVAQHSSGKWRRLLVYALFLDVKGNDEVRSGCSLSSSRKAVVSGLSQPVAEVHAPVT
jgi:hypothetical protein